MRELRFDQLAVIIALGLLGWALCGAIMFVGIALTSLQTTLVVHAIGALLSTYFTGTVFNTQLSKPKTA